MKRTDAMKIFKNSSFNRYPRIAQFVLLAAIQATAFAGTSFLQHNLVSGVPGFADQTDPNLVNPRGMASSATGPLWISNNHSGSTTVYNGQRPALSRRKPSNCPDSRVNGWKSAAAPTSQVFNSTPAFVLSGWNTSAGASAVIMVDNSASGAVYKGIALGHTGSGPLLYASNFSAGTIDVLDGNFSRVNLQGSFTDPDLPPSFAPFNIQNIGNRLYVAYARQDGARRDGVSGQGNGFLDVLDFDGLSRRAGQSGDALNLRGQRAVQGSDDLVNREILLPVDAVTRAVTFATAVQPEKTRQSVWSKLPLQHFERETLELLIRHVLDRDHSPRSRIRRRSSEGRQTRHSQWLRAPWRVR
jgi:hypothetical protein